MASLKAYFNYYSLFCLFVLSTGFRLHPFHASVTEINFNEKEKIAEISIKIFTDDLEKSIRGANKNIKINQNLIEQYISKHFVAKDSQNKAIPYSFIGQEVQQEATWIYIEMPLKTRSIILENTLLVETFEDQNNIINTKKDSFLLNKTNKTRQLDF